MLVHKFESMLITVCATMLSSNLWREHPSHLTPVHETVRVFVCVPVCAVEWVRLVHKILILVFVWAEIRSC